MNVFLGIITKTGYGKIKDIEPLLEQKVSYLIRKTFFDYIEPTESVEYSDSGKSALFLMSLRNESLQNKGEIFKRYAITNTGYPYDEYEKLLENNGCDKKCVSSLNGVFRYVFWTKRTMKSEHIITICVWRMYITLRISIFITFQHEHC